MTEVPHDLAAIPAVLLAYQQRWVSETAPVAIWEKSRRIGASWCDACDSVLFSSEEGGDDSLYIGYSEDMTREYIDDCAMWARAFNTVASAVDEFMFDDVSDDGEDVRQIKAFRIDFNSGKKILALSSKPRSIRGKQGKVSIDEAAFHDDLPGLMKAALALLIWGGKVRIISSHNGEEHPFNELILAARAHRVPYVVHRTTFDDALADGLYRRVCLRTGKEWSAEAEQKWRDEIRAMYRDNAEEELDVIPSQGSGIWLPRALLHARKTAAPVIRYIAPAGMALWPEQAIDEAVDDFCQEHLQPLIDQLDPTLRSVFGQDFGRHSDLSSFAPAQIQKNLRKHTPFMLEMANTPYHAQERFLFYIVDRLPRFSHGKLDAGGNGDYLAEQAQRKYGEIRIEKVKFSEEWYRENTAPLKADLEDDMQSIPGDADVIDDLAAFRKIRGVPRIPDVRTKGAQGLKRHGDAGIAILLCNAASRADYVEIEFESLGESRAGYELSDFLGDAA